LESQSPMPTTADETEDKSKSKPVTGSIGEFLAVSHSAFLVYFVIFRQDPNHALGKSISDDSGWAALRGIIIENNK
jgi:hypothetical protein